MTLIAEKAVQERAHFAQWGSSWLTS